MAYELYKKDLEKTILVYDLGDDTFYVTILPIDDGVFDVILIHGDTHLGGEDFDQRVIKFYMRLIEKKYNTNIEKNKHAIQKLNKEIKKAKRVLSTNLEYSIYIPELVYGIDFGQNLALAKFEQLNADLFKGTLKSVERALENSQKKKNEIEETVLVRGSTRIPKIKQILKEFFYGKEPNAFFNSDEAVAYGAAVQGAVLCGNSSLTTDIILLNVVSLTMDIETVGGIMTKIIQRNHKFTAKKSQVFTNY